MGTNNRKGASAGIYDSHGGDASRRVLIDLELLGGVWTTFMEQHVKRSDVIIFLKSK